MQEEDRSRSRVTIPLPRQRECNGLKIEIECGVTILRKHAMVLPEKEIALTDIQYIWKVRGLQVPP